MLLEFTGLTKLSAILVEVEQLGGAMLQGSGKVLQKAVNALNTHPIHGAVSSIPGFMDPGIMGWNWEWHHSLLLPSDSLAKRLLPIPLTFCSASLEVLVLGKGMLPPRETQ